MSAKHIQVQEKKILGLKPKLFYIVLAVILAVLLCVYAAGVFYFSHNLLPHTSYQNQDVSYQNISEIAHRAAQKFNSYQAQLQGDTIQIKIKPQDVGMSFDEQDWARNCIDETNFWAWPIEIFRSRSIDSAPQAKVDQSKLSTLLAPLVEEANKTATPATNAQVGFVEAEDKFGVIPEILGTELDLDKLVAHVEKEIMSFNSTIKVDNSCYKLPPITKDDPQLKKSADAANVFLCGPIELKIGEKAAWTVTNASIASWVRFDQAGQPSLDSAALEKWCVDDLSAQLDTAGSERSYTRPDGKVVQVKGGNYGWVIDGKGLAQALDQQIKAKSNAAISVPLKQQGNSYDGRGKADWGNTYIDIDLAEQYARFYRDGAIVWESAFVSGNPNRGHSTPVGVYYINGKQRNITLVGLPKPGEKEPEYKTPVSYWMPFVGSMVGLHDAYWRADGSFGGSYYRSSGSHGCINLPPKAAAKLYEIISVGTPVISHF